MIPAAVDAANDAWSGPPAEREPGADLCLLRLESEVTIAPAQLGIFTTDLAGRKFRAAGFPTGWDVDFANGDIVGRDRNKLYLLRPHQEALAVISTGTRQGL